MYKNKQETLQRRRKNQYWEFSHFKTLKYRNLSSSLAKEINTYLFDGIEKSERDTHI